MKREAMTHHSMRLISTVIGLSLTLGLVGCDYWPPALQAEIEQLRAEIQTLTIEKMQLQAQVIDLSKTKQELQGQVDELSRINREKTGIITGLQNQWDAARARALKARAPKTPLHKTPAKPAMKAAAKPTSKNTPNASVSKKSAPIR
jgi:TolA-binding protein